MNWAVFLVPLLLLMTVSPAHATPLLPGGTVVPGSLGYSGGTLADTGLVSYSFGGGTQTGTVRELVVANTLNPLGAGDLAFVFQVHVTTGDITTVSSGSYRDNAFSAFLTDIEQSAGLAPLITTGVHTAADAHRSSTGQTVDFDFIPEIDFGGTPGAVDTSVALIVNTNATIFTSGFIGLQDTGATQVNGFAPATATPEPGSLLSLGAALIGLFAVNLKRKKA